MVMIQVWMKDWREKLIELSWWKRSTLEIKWKSLRLYLLSKQSMRLIDSSWAMKRRMMRDKWDTRGNTKSFKTTWREEMITMRTKFWKEKLRRGLTMKTWSIREYSRHRESWMKDLHCESNKGHFSKILLGKNNWIKWMRGENLKLFKEKWLNLKMIFLNRSRTATYLLKWVFKKIKLNVKCCTDRCSNLKLTTTNTWALKERWQKLRKESTKKT